MEVKTCNKCEKTKTIENFRLKKGKNDKYYIYSYCKECEKLIKKNYYNKEKIKAKNELYRKNNKEKLKKTYQKYKENNYYKKYKENNYYKKYKEKNIEKYKKYWKKYRQKLKENQFECLKLQARDVVRNAFRRKGYSKNTKTEKILGCDYEVFIKHLLNTFKKNYGYEYNGKEKVHIDHIIPLVTAKTEQEIEKLCNYKNLQLLRAKDNLQKGKKINYSL